MALLEIENLKVAFGGIKALDGVSFSVEPKSFVGLMGSNGAGKTTVINCISRVISPDEGRIIFDGKDTRGLRGDQITDLGISRTFQDLSFFNLLSDMLVTDYMKIGQLSLDRGNLLDGLQIRRSKEKERALKESARRVLEFFSDIRELLEPPQEERGYPILFGREGFPDLLDVEYRPIGILSFAWRRRLDLARALVSKPKLLLLDEPAQGLPPSEIENLGKVLKLIREEFGISALIVEHNVPTLAAISDKIIAMNHGQIVTQGEPEFVRNHPEVIETYLGRPSEALRMDRVKPGAIKGAAPLAPLLEVNAIDLFYGQAQALFSVSIKLLPSQVACVLGTNGSGKSTLLRAISGLEKPVSGQILLNGEYLPLGWPEEAVERGVQYVTQGHSLFPNLTVRDNMLIGTFGLGRKVKKDDFDRVYEYFPALAELETKSAIDLSGGQRQMLSIAQALMARPKLLMLDEPSLGLSPKYVDLIFEIIRRISDKEDCSVLLVEQSVANSVGVSDFVYMMSAGMIVGEGPSELFDKDKSIIMRNLGFY